ncbi:hypothetical protein N7501_007978 [Penicillium viridicatum]|nr:hypothetical protein N7501_007978 [Penicillium viridicatum]
MEIQLSTKDQIYTTGDSIRGELLLKERGSCERLRISLTLIGAARVVVTTLAPLANSGSTVDNVFLKMHQFDHALELYPKNGIFPILFVVPDALPSDPCSEPMAGVGFNHGHCQLPPSIHYKADQFCPQMCSVAYYIYAEVALECGEKLHVKRPVRLLPSYLERPPRLWVNSGNVQLSDATRLRKTLWAASQGQLTVYSPQQKSAYLPIDTRGRSDIAPIHLDLDFDLEGVEVSNELPQQCQLRTVLEAVTYLTTTPMSDLPDGVRFRDDPNAQVFRRSLCLWKNKGVALNWVERNGKASGSRQAAILVPVVVPEEASIPPTFYHCYISREYFMRVELVVGRSQPLHLKLPLQIYNSLEC